MILIGQIRLAIRAPRRHRADALRHGVRASAVVGVRRHGQDPAAKSAGARADAGPRRRRGADRQPHHPGLSRQLRSASSARCFRCASRRATRRCGSPHWRPAPARRPSASSTRSACTREVSEVWVEPLPLADPGHACRARGRSRRPAGRLLVRRRIGHADIAVAAVLRFISEAHPGWFRWRIFRRSPRTPRGWRRCRCFRRSRSHSSRRREHSCAIKGCGNLPLWHKMTQYQYIASSVSRHCADRPLISNHSDVRLM